MTDKRENHKAPNLENKRNDVGRPEDKKGDKKTPPRFTNFNGEPIE